MNVHGMPAGQYGQPHTEIWPNEDIAEARKAERLAAQERES